MTGPNVCVASWRETVSKAGSADGCAPAAGQRTGVACEPALQRYHLLPAVRGDLLAKLCRFAEVRKEFERAASFTRNGSERKLLPERAPACARRLEYPASRS